jgi:hypothetical protein
MEQTPRKTPSTAQLEAIRDRLKIVGPGPTAMFADACRLIANPADRVSHGADSA